MSDIPENCTGHFAFQIRPSEHAALRAEAERKGLSQAALIRSKFPGILESAIPGRRFGFSPNRKEGISPQRRTG